VIDLLVRYGRMLFDWVRSLTVAPAPSKPTSDQTLTIGGNVTAGRDFVGRDQGAPKGDK